MNNPKYNFVLCLAVMVLMMGLAVLAVQTPSTAYAEASLPPRDTPTPMPGNDGNHRTDSPVGAYIELVAPDAPVGAWTVVQWQDSAGGWHDVEGWRGTVVGSSRWWVHPKDFGTGPFRWVVRMGSDGPQWAASASFHLPGQPNETVQVGAAPNP